MRQVTIMSEQQTRTPESVQREIKRTRHKAEIPIYIFSSIIGPAFLCIMYVAIFGQYGIVDKIKEGLALADMTESHPQFNAFLVGFIAVFAALGAIGFLCYIIVLQLYNYYKMYADDMCYSIRVTEENYPEIYAKVQEFTKLLGWKKEPEVYVQQMNGDINAYASWVPGKRYVHLNAEIVDLVYLEHKDIDTISFIMGHEFGHLYWNHVPLHYNFLANFAKMIPFFGMKIIGPLLERAREFTADRVAQALTDNKSSDKAMMLISGGRHGYKYLNANDYVVSADKDKNFIEKIARFIVNLFADHPIQTLRTKAILDPEKKSGRLL